MMRRKQWKRGASRIFCMTFFLFFIRCCFFKDAIGTQRYGFGCRKRERGMIFLKDELSPHSTLLSHATNSFATNSFLSKM